MTSTTYDSLGEHLDRLGRAIAASECHGAVAGVACTPAKDDTGWTRTVLGEPAPTIEEVDWLEELRVEVGEKLASTDMEFEPLLPDDDAPLADRTDSLARWCEGFLRGLAEGLSADRQLSGDVAEVIGDLTELTRAEHEGEDTEEGENAWTELSEFVRVGVQLVFEELRTDLRRDRQP